MIVFACSAILSEPGVRGDLAMRMKELIVVSILLALGIQGAGGAEEAVKAKAASAKSTVIHLSHYSGDLHAAVMALKITRVVQKRKAPVVLFLDLEGVRLADKRQPQDLRWGAGEPVSNYYQEVVKGGGKVLVCPHCARAAGLDSKNLRENAKIATEEEIADTIVNADRIMDY